MQINRLTLDKILREAHSPPIRFCEVFWKRVQTRKSLNDRARKAALLKGRFARPAVGKFFGGVGTFFQKSPHKKP